MTGKRATPALAALVGGLLVSGVLVTQSDGQAMKKIKVGWNYHMGNSPAVVAEEKGLFKKQGLDAEVKSFASGPAVSRGLGTKELDIAYVGFLPTYHDMLRGGLSVSVIAKSSYGLGSILVRKDSGINALRDLKGKKVAGSRKNSGNDVILRAFLLRELGGLDPEADVQVIQMGEEGKGEVVMNKQVDGAMTVEPFTSQYLLGGQTKIIVNTVDAAPHHPWYVVVVRTDFLKENRDVVVRALRAHVEAVKFLTTSQGEANDLIAQAFKQDGVTTEIARMARERVGFDYAISEKDMEFFDREIGWSRSLGIAKSPQKAAELVDLSLLKEATGGK
jgi:NitT/TauT family transport system substrate-binding protein